MSTALQIKGNLFTLNTFYLTSSSLSEIELQIMGKIKQAPQFFRHAPVIIDIHAIQKVIGPEFIEQLVVFLREHEIIPMGYRCNEPRLVEYLTDCYFPVFKDNRDMSSQQPKTNLTEMTSTIGSPSEEYIVHTENKIFDQKIRSGQQAIAEHGDLIVVAPISHGAELLSAGNIHVYGVLRGRVFAGLNGDENARIFCQKIEVDLVSIAGYYKTFEKDLPNRDNDTACYQIYLKNETIFIEPVKMSSTELS